MSRALLALHLAACTVFSLWLPLDVQTSYRHLELAPQGSKLEEPVSVTEVKGSLSTRVIIGQSQIPLTVFLSSRGVERKREGS